MGAKMTSQKEQSKLINSSQVQIEGGREGGGEVGCDVVT